MVRPKKKPVGNVITITMHPDIRKKLGEIAKKERRTRSAMIEYLIENYGKNL